MLTNDLIYFSCIGSLMIILVLMLSSGKKPRVPMLPPMPEKKPHLSYDDCFKILNSITDFYILQHISFMNIKGISQEEASLIVTDELVSLCANIKIAMSSHLNGQLLYYVTDEYIDTYVARISRLGLMLQIEKKR